MNRIISVIIALFATAALAQDKPVLAPMNNYQAYAEGIKAAHQSVSDRCESKVNALKTSAGQCKDDMCRVVFGVLMDKACGAGESGAQVAVAQPPAPERSGWEIAKDTVLDVARVALPFVDRVMSSKERRDATASAERQNLGLYSTFAGINGQTAALGTSGFGSLERLGTSGFGAIERTASNGFGALERGMVAGFTAPRDPTYQVNVGGSDNTLFGSTSNRSYANNCTSGNGGQGGQSGNSGAAGNGGATTSNGGASGATQAGAGAPSGSVPCNIQK